MFTSTNYVSNSPFSYLSHCHYLYPTLKQNYWLCDICKENYTIKTIAFNCAQCDFDVCLKCGKNLSALNLEGAVFNNNSPLNLEETVFDNKFGSG